METKQDPTKSPFVKKTPVQTSTGKNAAPSTASSTPSVTSSSPPVMQSFGTDKKGVTGGKVVLVLVLMVFLGVGVGYGASLVSAKTGTSIVPNSLNPNAPAKGKIYG